MLMQRYVFQAKNIPIITYWVARKLLNALKLGLRMCEVTTDLGLTRTTALIDSNAVYIGNNAVSIQDLELVKEDLMYAVFNNGLRPLSLYDANLRRYYKLRPIAEDTAPTLEINGAHMHRIEGITPWEDSRIKVGVLGDLRGATVLDTCTGLGYTAILSLKGGARSVVTVEVDGNVLELATYNPWSAGLANDRISIYNADVTEYIQYLRDSAFTHVIHDPPRISIAGELYSAEFYRELLRVLKVGGKLFHYTGRPGKHGGHKYLKGIKDRLRRAGFTHVIWVERASGFLAIKTA